jgi:glyoxylase-like metal-dependent hydrolase (beta-lactamase superfamily II)
MAWMKRAGPVFDGVVNVGSPDLSSYLVVGSEKTLLVDANMGFMSGTVRASLARCLPPGRGLDGVLLTHTHFDHVGGIPRLREIFPNLVVYASPVAARVLRRESAQWFIRDLNMEASRLHGGSLAELEYDFSLMAVDHVLADGEEIALGDDTVVAMETPGHTRCSITYLLRGRKAIFGGEAFGVKLQDGTVCPEYLSSYEHYVRSLRRCQTTRPEIICLPHFGILTEGDAQAYWGSAMAGAKESAAIIVAMVREGYGRAEIIHLLKKKYYIEDLSSFQQERAFEINAGHSTDLITGLLASGLLPSGVQRRCGIVAPMLANGMGFTKGEEHASGLERARAEPARPPQ